MRALYPLIRRAPRWMIDAAYLALETVDPIAVARYRRRFPGELPMPGMRLRARVGSRGIAQFLAAGASCAEALQNAARTHLGIELTGAGAILDFGCGCGRTIRHLGSSRVHGCDVDREAIDWMQANVDATRFAVNSFDPPLPWADETFDLLYSVSIFTHLNESSQLAWLREIARVLRRGGSALITVQGEHALSRFMHDEIYATASMKSRLAGRSPLRATEFVFEPYEVAGGKLFPGVAAYGLAFHGSDYLERVWGEIFDVRGIDVGTIDGLQDVVVVTRR